MMVSLMAHDPCGLCGYIRKAFTFSSMRINKRSMRSQGTNIALLFGQCRECGIDAGSPIATRWVLDPDSAQRVEMYRLRRWPELAASA